MTLQVTFVFLATMENCRKGEGWIIISHPPLGIESDSNVLGNMTEETMPGSIWRATQTSGRLPFTEVIFRELATYLTVKCFVRDPDRNMRTALTETT